MTTINVDRKQIAGIDSAIRVLATRKFAEDHLNLGRLGRTATAMIRAATPRGDRRLRLDTDPYNDYSHLFKGWKSEEDEQAWGNGGNRARLVISHEESADEMISQVLGVTEFGRRSKTVDGRMFFKTRMSPNGSVSARKKYLRRVKKVRQPAQRGNKAISKAYQWIRSELNKSMRQYSSDVSKTFASGRSVVRGN
jgi:hypothetical protein